MLDVTLDLPLDLKRICQPNAKVYMTDTKQFGTVTAFADTVTVKLDQGKASKAETYSRLDFIDKITNDIIVSKSRVVIPDGDTGNVRVKPRVIAQEPLTMDPLVSRSSEPAHLVRAVTPVVQELLLVGYIDEKTGKFSKTLQTGMIQIEYRKITRKVQLELDSVQLQKLKELGIIVDE